MKKISNIIFLIGLILWIISIILYVTNIIHTMLLVWISLSIEGVGIIGLISIQILYLITDYKGYKKLKR